MGGKNATDAAKEDASDQPQAGCRSGIYAFQEPVGDDQGYDNDKGSKHPQEELSASQQPQELVQIV